MTRSKRNNEIDMLRFVFALAVAAFHCNLGTGLNLCCHGNIAVEFFFVTSGYLTAKSILEKEVQIKAAGYLKRRLFSFYPIWVAAVIVYLAYDLISGETENITFYIFDLFLLQSFVPFSGKMAFGWYLSVLMIDTVILFPCLVRAKKSGKYKRFLIAATVIDLALIVALFIFSHRITNTEEYIWIIKKIHIRGMCGMLMGVVIYLTVMLAERSGALKKPIISSAVALNILKGAAGVYLFVFINTRSPESGVGEFIALGCMGIVVLCAGVYEKTTVRKADGRFYENVDIICCRAGEMSMYIYIFHILIIDIVKRNSDSLGNLEQLALVTAMCVIVSAAAAAIRTFLKLKRRSDR